MEYYLWPPLLKSNSKFQILLNSLGTGKWFESPRGLSRSWVFGGTQLGKLEKQRKVVGWKFRSTEQSQRAQISRRETSLMFVVPLKFMETSFWLRNMPVTGLHMFTYSMRAEMLSMSRLIVSSRARH